ncbi:MAG: hypothetical protein HY721_31965 [Planctomycetes bacterium]|nr:hypothetical protein [Planctomycetota bacterium]
MPLAASHAAGTADPADTDLTRGPPLLVAVLILHRRSSTPTACTGSVELRSTDRVNSEPGQASGGFGDQAKDSS